MSSDSAALKMCPLEQKALELLREAQDAKGGRFIRYNEAAAALVRLRVDRKTTLKLLSEFAQRGILEQSCGHGVKLIEEPGGAERQ